MHENDALYNILMFLRPILRLGIRLPCNYSQIKESSLHNFDGYDEKPLQSTNDVTLTKMIKDHNNLSKVIKTAQQILSNK